MGRSYTDYSQIFAVIAPFTNSMLDFFPKDDITSCTVPQMHVYKSLEDSNLQVISLSSVRLCISVSFKQLPLLLINPICLKKTK